MKRLSLILAVSSLAAATTPGQQAPQFLEQQVSLNTAVNRQQDARLAGLESDVSQLKSTPHISHPPHHPISGQPSGPSGASTYTVSNGDTFFSIARRHATSTAQLQAANPGVDPNRLKIGQRINVPGAVNPSPTPSPSPNPSQAPLPPTSSPYVVVSGDSLSSIARRHGTSVPALQRANGLSSDILQIGQNLLIPGSNTGGSPSASPPYPAQDPTAPSPAPAPQYPAASLTHTVRPGETLSGIARQYRTSINAIVASSPGLSNPNQLAVGQQLTIPSNTANPIASQPGSPQAQPGPQPPSAPSTPPSYFGLLNYELRAGETLDSIAPKFGTSTTEILRINGLRSISEVRPGDIILVPGTSLQAGHTGP